MIKVSCKRQAFTLLEVVVALAMLALIAVPAIGLATMAVGSSKEQIVIGTASELKSRVDLALRAVEITGGLDTESDERLVLVADKDLRFIELEAGTNIALDKQHFHIIVHAPEGYAYQAGDPFRMVVYEVVWPYKTSELGTRNQLFFTSVFKK